MQRQNSDVTSPPFFTADVWTREIEKFQRISQRYGNRREVPIALLRFNNNNYDMTNCRYTESQNTYLVSRSIYGFFVFKRIYDIIITI